MKLALILLALGCTAAAAAEPRNGTCSGELSVLPEGEWVIRTGREGICTFSNDAVKTKVLATCSRGEGCAVTGLIGNCPDPECSEIMRVQSVRRIRKRAR